MTGYVSGNKKRIADNQFMAFYLGGGILLIIASLLLHGNPLKKRTPTWDEYYERASSEI